jgi:uridine kinase
MLGGFRLGPGDEGLALELGARDPRLAGAPATPRARARGNGDGDMVADHQRWLDGMGVTSVGAFNELCISGQVTQLIRVTEGFQEKRIGQIADLIRARRDRVRIISIAGPSSSGKTTFIKRLTVQLQIDGVNPLAISLDDYYVDRVRTPKDARGEYDFEALEALDLALLQDHVARLLRGETVRTAHYDFKTGTSHPSGGPEITLRPGDVLMLEGIHGLNPGLLGAATRAGELFRIFIHPATTLPFDRLTRVSATDLRLLRRIVRDRHQRGYGAAENILRWPSVQAGERAHIFPFQGEADAVFDTSLVYEPAVLKVYAERYLLEVPSDHPAYPTALRLRHLVDRFVSIYPDHVPPTSLIREFIGGSGFEY